ncbi:MAG TPA: oxidoreductase [Terriglobia bacterium]|nr:oxidoreductase [Terriglobia bacterium]
MNMEPNPASPNLIGKTALITGSSRGIGAGIARSFAESGAKVSIHGIDAEEGSKVAAAICASGGMAQMLGGDLRDEAQCRALVHNALRKFGQLDILVNNAAIYPRGNLETTPVALWDEVFAVNLRAPFILCQEAVAHMKPRNCGCIINVGSVNGVFGLPKLLAYSSSKGGLTTLTKNLSNALTKHRIRVNQINPGWVLTEGERHVQSVIEGRGEGWLEEVVKTRPFGRMLLPEDIARAALFLATSPLITGAVIDYDQLPVGAPHEF